jgi:trimeric autotransporter adhesin
MKKIYLFLLLCCLGLPAFSQITTVIYAGTYPGSSYNTGRSTATVRSAGNPNTNTTTRGYAVFDLSGIPAGSAVSGVVLGLDLIASSVAVACSTYVYPGDLSTVTVPGTLFADMVSPAAVLVNTVSYGGATANITLASTPAAEAAVQAGAGGKVSFTFTTSGPTSYTITGETGTTALSGAHAPYIQVTYCPPPTAVSATASPGTLCEGDLLTLTGSATGATDYVWTGPGGFTTSAASTSLIVTPSSAGVYTLTASVTCGAGTASATAVTSAVTVNPIPAAITGANSVCVGSATTLGDVTFGGSWTASNARATIGLTTGIVTGVSSGLVTMSYTLPTGCYVTLPMRVNDPPTPIGGPVAVCENANITLTDGSPVGQWTSTYGNVSVGLATGVVTGISAGFATITYTPGGCPFATYDITVNPIPAPIVGATQVCVLGTTTETDADPGGVWSTSNITIAFIGSTTGIVTGVSGGAVSVIYTFTSTGCRNTLPFFVNALPAPIGGPTAVCSNGTITLTDVTPGGTFSGGAPHASVTPGGIVSGISAGTAGITYTVGATGCRTATPINVNAIPSPITGSSVFCQNSTTTLTDPDPGGTWSSQNTTIATVGSLSGIVTGLATPGTNISYAFVTTGCAAVFPVTINAAPPAVITPAGATVFCAGGNVVLDGTTASGVTYQWRNSSGPIPGATNASYTASASSSYTVDISNALGCHAISAPQVVTAGINPTITHATSLGFCIGMNVVLTADVDSTIDALSAAGIDTLTYQWKKGGVAIPGATNVTYTADSAGAYTVDVTVSGGSGLCTATTPAVTTVVNNYPTPSITNTGTMLKTASTYVTYQWYLNTVAIPGATNYTYIPLANGNYRVIVGDILGCHGTSNGYNIAGVGVTQVSADEISIYPNPANNVVHIESPVAVRAVITGMEGKTLIDENNAHEININSLANGLYLITLYDGNGNRVLVQKLIKE